MKQLILKIVIPLTIISFATYTKWWYVLVVDGTDEILTGFPLPFVCRGWHTSGSLQIFMAEFLIDLLIYFLTWLSIIFCISRLLVKFNASKVLTILFYSLAALIVLATSFIASNSNNLFYLKRNFDIEIMETGYKFSWQDIERPDYYKYHPERKPIYQ